MFSIVIPAYNEEKFLPGLLKSIRKQNISHEIIVSDNNSEDDTRNIAKRFCCRVVEGGHPGKARNNGAHFASYDGLLFMDADIVLPDNFLQEVDNRCNNLDFASFMIKPLSENSDHVFYYMLKNYFSIITNPIWTHASGQCFYIKKKIFEKINGYDETLIMGEDHDIAKRAKKHGNGKFFSDLYVYNHPRRLIKEGTYRTLGKDIYSEVYRLFKKGAKVYEKEYGHY